MQPEIRNLQVHDAPALAALWQNQHGDYVRFFRPFSFAEDSLRESLENLHQDAWWGIFLGAELGGFFMMRGKDAGFSRYAFGVLIGEKYAGRGWGKWALQEALRWAWERGEESVILSVAEENVVALRIYESMGFLPTGEKTEAGQPIFALKRPA